MASSACGIHPGWGSPIVTQVHPSGTSPKTYLSGLVLGHLLLQTGMLDGVQLHSGALLHSAMDAAVEPIQYVHMDAWLSKPVDPEVLPRTVRQYLPLRQT